MGTDRRMQLVSVHAQAIFSVRASSSKQTVQRMAGRCMWLLEGKDACHRNGKAAALDWGATACTQMSVSERCHMHGPSQHLR